MTTGKVYHPNEPSWVVSTPTNSGSYKDTLYQTIKVGNEFYFPELGFSIVVIGTINATKNAPWILRARDLRTFSIVARFMRTDSVIVCLFLH